MNGELPPLASFCFGLEKQASLLFAHLNRRIVNGQMKIRTMNHDAKVRICGCGLRICVWWDYKSRERGVSEFSLDIIYLAVLKAMTCAQAVKSDTTGRAV